MYIQRAQHTRLLLGIINHIPGSIQPSEDAESNCHKENQTAHETLVCAMLYASHLRLLTAFNPPNSPWLVLLVDAVCATQIPPSGLSSLQLLGVLLAKFFPRNHTPDGRERPHP